MGFHDRIERKDESGAPQIDTKKAVTELMSAFEEFKSSNDERLTELSKKGSADPLLEEKLGKINTKLDSFEGMNQRIAEAEKKAKAIEDLNGRFDQIETMLRRTGGTSQEEAKARAGIYARAVVDAHTLGVPNLSEEQRKTLTDIQAEYKALNVTTDAQGGYLAPVEYVREIIKGVTEISPVRGLVRVRSTSSKSIEIPKRTGQFSAQRVTEAGARTETTGLTYGMVEIAAPEMYALIDITNQMLEDSAFDIAAEVQAEAVDQFAVLEGNEFVTGTGSGQMEGILTAVGTGSVNSGATATITADGIIKLKYSVKSAYAANGTFGLNRTTLRSARLLKDANNQYLWQPGLAQGRPNTLDGDPYVELSAMPSEGAGLKPIAYGDMRRAYTLLDRISMEMLRDPYTQATAGAVRFIMRKRMGGKVVLPEALSIMTCAA